MRKVKWTGRGDTPGAYLYRINVRYRSECIRNTGECYGDKVGMERRMEGIGHRRVEEQGCRPGGRAAGEPENKNSSSNRERALRDGEEEG